MENYRRYYSRGPGATHCLVFDMDDTLCHYDEVKRLRHCHSFLPRERELAIALAAQRHGYDIVIATARPHFCHLSTRVWLSKHGVNVAAVYMRNGGCSRETSASAIKQEMLSDILSSWQVEAFYDDSHWTIAAAQQLGVNAIHVPGNEEYWNGPGRERAVSLTAVDGLPPLLLTQNAV